MGFLGKNWHENICDFFNIMQCSYQDEEDEDDNKKDESEESEYAEDSDFEDDSD